MVSTLHSRAFCGAGFYLAKRVFPGFGSCNGHVTAITYGAELNVGEKSRTLKVVFVCGSYCCSVVSVKHFNTVKSPTLRCGEKMRFRPPESPFSLENWAFLPNQWQARLNPYPGLQNWVVFWDLSGFFLYGDLRSPHPLFPEWNLSKFHESFDEIRSGFIETVSRN